MIIFTATLHGYPYPVNFHDTEQSALDHSRATEGSIDVALDISYRYCTNLSCTTCPLNNNNSNCGGLDLMEAARLDPIISDSLPEIFI